MAQIRCAMNKADILHVNKGINVLWLDLETSEMDAPFGLDVAGAKALRDALNRFITENGSR